MEQINLRIIFSAHRLAHLLINWLFHILYEHTVSITQRSVTLTRFTANIVSHSRTNRPCKYATKAANHQESKHPGWNMNLNSCSNESSIQETKISVYELIKNVHLKLHLNIHNCPSGHGDHRCGHWKTGQYLVQLSGIVVLMYYWPWDVGSI